MEDYSWGSTGINSGFESLPNFYTNEDQVNALGSISNAIGFGEDWGNYLEGLGSEDFGTNESGAFNTRSGYELSPEFLQQLQNYKFNTSLEDGNYYMNVADKSGKSYGKHRYGDLGTSGDKALAMGVGALLSATGQGILGPMFGGGILGNALGGGITSGSLSSLYGGDFGQGFLQGAVGGGLGGANPAGMMGIENPLLAQGINSTLSGTARGLAGGKDLGEAFKGAAQSAVIGTGTSAMNDFFGNLWNSFGSTPQEGSDSFMGPPSWAGGNQFYGPPDLNAGSQQLMGPPADLANNFMGPPADLSQNVMGNSVELFPNTNTSTTAPTNRALSFNLPSVGQLGSFAANNAGTLAQMLYGMYNNRKQQKMLGGAISGLQGLYGQNSPYAQQLRAKLNAQAAASGKRSNTGARETQLQAMLADRAAATMPQLYQMMMGQNQLRNSMASNVIGSLGQLKGLGGLFGIGGG